ncbi:MAG: aminodeoxychorismate synthase component I [Bacillota bacterium]
MIEQLTTDLTAFELYTIFKDQDYSFILDSNLNNKLGRYSLISANPFEILKYDYQEQPLIELRTKLANYKIDNNTELPFIGGAVGYLGYDLCHCIETLPQRAVDDLKIPDLYLGLYNWVLVVDHQQQQVYFASPDLNKKKEQEIKNRVINRIKSFEQNKDNIQQQSVELNPTKLRANFSRAEYLAAVKQVKKHIKQGDIYQANLSQRFSGTVNCTSYQLYQRLREVSPAPFAALLQFPEVDILSNSPERFIEVEDKRVETRPIKGTRPRGATSEEDQKLKAELLASEKDKAELLMIVDLERNDLAKVAQLGSVKVPELYQLEEYANVHHLVATIEAQLKADNNVVDLIKATFPGGSITGAPKIRSMEIIDKLEPTQRKVYTGSIGYIGFDGRVDLNIAIRTIIKQQEEIHFQVGGGITWDSNPEAEYQETLDKAESIMKAVLGYYAE